MSEVPLYRTSMTTYSDPLAEKVFTEVIPPELSMNCVWAAEITTRRGHIFVF